jgi:hypothetical protein
VIAFDWDIGVLSPYAPFMKRFSRFFPVLFIAALGLLVLNAAPARAEAVRNPLVVELFTSQGCSSCPPSDAYLSELAARPDILALSLHVDYWNGLGWRDPYSSAEVTARQRDYVRTLNGSYVYTPQMVIGGRAHAVGSDRAKVAALIAAPRPDSAYAPRLDLSRSGPVALDIAIGEATFIGRATVWLVAFDNRHTTEVASGENSGRRLSYSNVVRAVRAVGQWTGRATTLKVGIGSEKKAGFENIAVIVQAGGTGPIIVAGRHALSRYAGVIFIPGVMLKVC